jgi:glutathione S-transferase
MTIVLHRFPFSHFAEKARVALDYKELDYRVEDHAPGPGQIAIYRLSGQRKVPVLEHDGVIVADSTEICFYLDRAFPDRRPLLPRDEAERREAIALEDRIDDVLGKSAPAIGIHMAARDERAREAMNLDASPVTAVILDAAAAAFRAAEGSLPPFSALFEKADHDARAILRDLVRRLKTSKYLVGDAPSLADIAAVGLANPLKILPSRHLPNRAIAGASVASFTEDPELAPFFAWRDKFFSDYLH